MSLTDDLTGDQKQLVELVCAAFFQNGQWPIFQFVEARLQQSGIDALTTLKSFPYVGSDGHGARYSPVFYERTGRSTPSPGSQVMLTLAGLRHIPNDNGLTDDFLHLIGLLVSERARAPYSPIHEVSVKITRRQIANIYPPGSERIKLLHGLAKREPPTWSGLSTQPTDDYWWHDIGPSIRDYAELTDVDDYLRRVTTQLELPQVRERPVPPHPRALVGAIDYLDTVWQLRFSKKRLVRIESLERAALLALPVDNADAFDSALSAFADVLGHLSVPDQPGAPDQHPLTKLDTFLAPRLPGANAERIRGALTTLTLIKTVRHGMQHSKAAPDAAAALHTLGIGYPVRDWAWAWDAIRYAAINAFESLREEIQVARRN